MSEFLVNIAQDTSGWWSVSIVRKDSASPVELNRFKSYTKANQYATQIAQAIWGVDNVRNYDLSKWIDEGKE